jgi:hypothetical protein
MPDLLSAVMGVVLGYGWARLPRRAVAEADLVGLDEQGVVVELGYADIYYVNRVGAGVGADD